MNIYENEKLIIKGCFKLATEQKKEQFEKFLNRTFSLTSDTSWYGEVLTSKKGTYFKIKGTRSSFTVFIDCFGNIKRKPKNLTNTRIHYIKGYENVIEEIEF